MVTQIESVSCYSQRKVKNSESKSQLSQFVQIDFAGCYSQRKVKNSKSKLQHVTRQCN